MPLNSQPDPINGLSLLDRFSGFVRQLSSSSTSGTYLVTSPDTHKNRHQSDIAENGKKYLWESLFKSNVYNEHFQRPTSILNVNIVPCLKYSESISTRDVEAIIIDAYLRGVLPYTPSHVVLHGKSSKFMAKHDTPICILDSHVQASYSGPEEFKPNLTLNPSKHTYIPSIETFLTHVNTHLTQNKITSAITPNLSSHKREEPLNFEQSFETAMENSVINPIPPPLPPPLNGHTYSKYDDCGEIKASNTLEVGMNLGKMSLGNSVSIDSIKFIDDPPHNIIEECQNLQNTNQLSPKNCCELSSPPVVDNSWKNEKLDWSSPTDFAFGLSTTLYERQPGTNDTFAGDPIADAFAIRAQSNGAILALADGVNWGRKARIAARSAIQGAMKYLEDMLCCPHNGNLKPRSTLELFEHLLKAFYVAHCEILRRSGGLTTLTLAIVCQMVPDRDDDDVWLKKASEYGVCVCNVGDSNAYIFDPKTGNITEITAGSRDIHAMRNLRDAGGALGPFEGTQMPELNNLTLSQARGLRSGDVVYLTSDGVSDNMDPLVRKKALYPRQPQTTDPALPLSNGRDELGATKNADHITGDKSKGGWQNILAPRSSSVKPIQSDWINKHITCPPQITALQRYELTLIHMSCVMTDWMYCPEISKLVPNSNPGPRPALHSVGHAARDDDILRCETSKSLLHWRPALRRAQSTPHSKATTTPHYNLNTCLTQKTTILTPSPDDVFGAQGPEDINSSVNPRPAFAITARQLCGRLLNYCLQATEGKRKILEHPSLYDNGHANKAEGDASDSESEFEVLKAQKDRRKRVRHKLSLAAGKLDHATIVAYQINAGNRENSSPGSTTVDQLSNRSNVDSSKSKNSCRKANTRQSIETQL